MVKEANLCRISLQIPLGLLVALFTWSIFLKYSLPDTPTFVFIHMCIITPLINMCHSSILWASLSLFLQLLLHASQLHIYTLLPNFAQSVYETLYQIDSVLIWYLTAQLCSPSALCIHSGTPLFCAILTMRGLVVSWPLTGCGTS